LISKIMGHLGVDPGGDDEGVEVADGGQEGLDLGLVGHVARERLDVAAELGGQRLDALRVAVGDQQAAPRGELAGHRGAHPGRGTDHDVGHLFPLELCLRWLRASSSSARAIRGEGAEPAPGRW
jgi:hypothetical protein